MREILTEGSRSSSAHPFAGLPFSAFWVLLSGREMLGRKRWFEPGAGLYMFVALVWLAAGVAGMCVALRGEPWQAPLYVASMVLIVGGTRYMVATTIHMMAHNLMFTTPVANTFW